jgi:hypothetical protein
MCKGQDADGTDELEQKHAFPCVLEVLKIRCLDHPHLGASATRNSVFSAGNSLPGDPGYSGIFP